MELKEVQELCKVLDCSATVSVLVCPGSSIKITAVSIREIDRKKILSKKEELARLGLKEFKKHFWSFQGGLDWEAKVGETMITFNKAQTCKIVGYETKVIPAQEATEEHEKKVPIYDCNGVRK